MNHLPLWRRRSFAVGAGLILLGAIDYGVAATRERQWMYKPNFTEGSIWIFSGMFCAVLAMLLILCGQGWRRLLLQLVAFIELYFWFSWLAWAVQMR
jgi:hypothetical protein